jgi:amino acid adenylation domain-containing protein
MRHLLHHLIDEAAQRWPEREALRFKGASMSYAGLLGRSNGVARAIVDLGVRPGDRVGLYLPKGFEQIAATYGILKAGACFVPLDPNAPPARVAEMVHDCEPSAIIATDGRASDLVPALGGYRPKGMLLVEGGAGRPELPFTVIDWAEATADPAAPDPGVRVMELDLCLIAYTSGSTGAPKGVMHNHASFSTATEWFTERWGLTVEDRLALHPALHFLMAPYMVWSAPRVGASIVIFGEDETGWGSEFVRLVREERITVWLGVSPAISQLVHAGAEPGSLPSLRVLIFGGAPFPRKDLEDLRRLLPSTQLAQVYGTTETLFNCLYPFWELPPDDGQPLSIGSGIEIVQPILMRDETTPCEQGEPGEYYVRTPTLMRGYWRLPELTRKVLVPNPLDPHNPDLVHRSGDVMRMGPDGNYYFVGRTDNQIKTRGYRVELEEVERCIASHPKVRQVAVVALPHPEWINVLGATVVPEDGEQLDGADVKGHVADRLPGYMVPAEVRIVADLPKGSSGKIDRSRIRDELLAGPAGS